jgi:hypothetical protein
MKKSDKIFIIVSSIIAVGTLGYIGYTIMRISALNKKVSTPLEASESIQKVAEENPNAEVIVSEEETAAAESGKYGNNGEAEMSPVSELNDLSDAEFNCYVYNDCTELDAEYYSSLTEDDTKPNF